MRAHGRIAEVLHFMFSVQHHGNDFMPAKSQEYAELVTIVRFYF